MSQRPNILFMHSHNTGRYVQPYGFDVPTPNLQRLAEQGVLFRQAFAAAPTCSPSRASLLTGQCPHSSGMLGLAHRGFSLNDPKQLLTHTLRAAGYTTVRAGLQHVTKTNERSERHLGYDTTLKPRSIYAPDVVPGAVAYLDSQPKQPFFLDVGIFETHTPFPEQPAEQARYTSVPMNLPDHPQIRQDFANFKAHARTMDDGYGALLDALDRNGLAENTLVICLADHGLQFPYGMCNLTDAGLETYFILRGPGGCTGGKVIDAIISHVDVFPSVCELAGIDAPDWLQGTSVLPLVSGDVESLHDEIFGEVTYHAAYEPMRCVRTKRYKYIKRYDGREHPVLTNLDPGLSRDAMLDLGIAEQRRWQEGLFDLMFDPHERDNRIADPALAGVLEDLRSRLDSWMQRTDDPILNGLPVQAPSGAILNDPDGFVHMEQPTVVP